MMFGMHQCPKCGLDDRDWVYIDPTCTWGYCGNCNDIFDVEQRYTETQVQGIITQVRSELQAQLEEAQSEAKKTQEDNKKLDEINAKLEACEKMIAILPDIQNATEENESILEEISFGVNQLATKEELQELCRHGELERKQSDADLKETIQKSNAELKATFEGYLGKIAERMESLGGNKEEAIQAVNGELAAQTRYLSGRFDGLERQLEAIKTYMMAQSQGNAEKQAQILEYLERLFSKEMMDEAMSAMGASLADIVRGSIQSELQSMIGGLGEGSLISIMKKLDEAFKMEKPELERESNKIKEEIEESKKAITNVIAASKKEILEQGAEIRDILEEWLPKILNLNEENLQKTLEVLRNTLEVLRNTTPTDLIKKLYDSMQASFQAQSEQIANVAQAQREQGEQIANVSQAQSEQGDEIKKVLEGIKEIKENLPQKGAKWATERVDDIKEDVAKGDYSEEQKDRINEEVAALEKAFGKIKTSKDSHCPFCGQANPTPRKTWGHCEICGRRFRDLDPDNRDWEKEVKDWRFEHTATLERLSSKRYSNPYQATLQEITVSAANGNTNKIKQAVNSQGVIILPKPTDLHGDSEKDRKIDYLAFKFGTEFQKLTTVLVPKGVFKEKYLEDIKGKYSFRIVEYD